MLPDQRCEDCGRPFRGEHPKRFEPCLCPRCAQIDEAHARPNIDPTREVTGDTYNFKHHGEGYPVLKQRTR
jgi:hypothetical protein